MRRPERCFMPGLLWIGLLLVTPPASAQENCPAVANPDAERGWAAYRDNRMPDADAAFEAALAACPRHVSARIGLAYVRLRGVRDDESRALFESALADAPDNTDVLTGLGLLAWRAGDLEEVADRFVRVLELNPEDPTALDYLGRLPEGLGLPPERIPLVLPDTLEYPSRVNGLDFEVRGEDGWEPFYVRAVNLGAALPGRYPSEFPDSTQYARWIADMAEMGTNAVRVYTIHPPHFYEALFEHNRSNPGTPLWLIHGVWTGLPPDDDYLGEEWESGFFEEMERVVDLVHGRADIRPRPGNASGFYTTDVSDWVLAYIIGREWEPHSVIAFDSIRTDYRSFEGEYLRVPQGNAMEAWLGRALEHLVAYETRTYRKQRPAAYTNWPTLDPMTHPTETTRAEEVALREARGERVLVPPREYDNDYIGLDPTATEATDAYPAGYFASYHAYPYYPDLMILNPEYREARSSFGPSTYFGYLTELRETHPGIPIVISEYGVPTSLGSAHLQPNGMHHGGLTEEEMAEINRRMTLEIEEAGMAGGALFAWIDEWFKKNWIVLEFELPEERNRLWKNRLDAEQHYGVYAMEARPAVEGQTLSERLRNWNGVEPLYREGARSVRLASDESYLWILVEEPGLGEGTYRLGFDMLDPEAGDFRWPGGGERLPVGLEFVLEVAGDEARLLVDPPQNPFRFDPVGQGVDDWEGLTFQVADPPPGLFTARAEQRFNVPYETVANDDGRYDSLRVLTNRRRLDRDGREYLAVGYDRGVLPAGNRPDGYWQRVPGGGVELRIPWMLLNITDPSSRSLLQGPGANRADTVLTAAGPRVVYPDSVTGVLGTTAIESIGIVAEGPGGAFPVEGPAARYSWDPWEEPQWRTRRRPTFDSMLDAFIRLGADRPTAAPRDEPAGPTESRDPRPPVVQVDSADLAWRAGDIVTARRIYAQRLEENPDDGGALHRMALMVAWDERYSESLALFDRLLAVQPENADARVDRARVVAWSGDTTGALEQLEGILDDDPANVRALEAAAQFQAWAGEHDASLSTYDALLAVQPGNASARRSQAQTLAWASRFDVAEQRYREILQDDPGDLDARLGLARVLTFDDRLEEALAEYDDVLERDAENIEAMRGRARALSWGSRLPEGETAWRAAVAAHPDDVGARIGLGQNLRWQGRNFAALEVLREAEARDPNNEDLQEQLRWIHAATGPRAAPDLVVESDSDDNLMVTSSISGSWYPMARLNLRLDGYRRDTEQRDLQNAAVGVTLTGSYQIEPGWTVFAGLGGSESDVEGSETITHLALGATTPGRYPLGATLTARRSALDATAVLVERGVAMEQLSLDGRWFPASGWRVYGSLGLAWFEATQTNRRWNASASASRRVAGPWTAGGSMRLFGFEEDLNEGYFDPDRYWIGELVGGWLWEPGRWSASVELAPGLQQVGSEGDVRGAIRANTRLTYRVAQGRQVSAGFGYSSSGLQSFATGESDYEYRAFLLSASWVIGDRGDVDGR